MPISYRLLRCRPYRLLAAVGALGVFPGLGVFVVHAPYSMPTILALIHTVTMQHLIWARGSTRPRFEGGFYTCRVDLPPDAQSLFAGR